MWSEQMKYHLALHLDCIVDAVAIPSLFLCAKAATDFSAS